jgi:hypothetical protein
MVTILTRLVAIIALYAGGALAQTSPLPGPTVPVAKTSEGLVVNPTKAECDIKWRRDLRWSRQEFDGACARSKVSE